MVEHRPYTSYVAGSSPVAPTMDTTQYEHIPLINRLVAVRDSIFKHGPEHFDMNSWFTDFGDTPYEERDFDEDSDEQFRQFDLSDFHYNKIDINDCGTAACIAGHTAIAAFDMDVEIETPEQAAKFLGLDQGDTSSWLGAKEFGHNYWEGTPLQQWENVVNWLDDLVIRS